MGNSKNKIIDLNKDKIKKNIILTKNNNNESDLNPKDIVFFSNLVNDSYSKYWLIDKFTVFKSINDILYLIYANKNKSIISYNIIDNKKINEIKNAHDKYITNFRYYMDYINNRDLIISISSNDNNIKLWNITNFELILNIKKIYDTGYLQSACFLNNNNQNYIITSNDCLNKIKVFDFKGEKIKEINDSEESTFYIDIYYDNNLFKNYIITGHRGYVKSYDYNKNKLYHKYYGDINDNDDYHMSIIINKKNEVIELIESSCNGNIRIWNLHSGILLKKMKLCNEKLREICLWNNVYIFVGCDNTIKLIDLNNGEIIKELKGHNNKVLSIKSIIHPKYGKCLISQGADNDPIKLWIIKK